MYRNSFPCTTLRMSNLQLCVYIIIICGAFSIDLCPTVRPAFSFFSFPFATFPVFSLSSTLSLFSIFHLTFELRFVLLAALCAGYCSTIITITIPIPICNSYQKSRPAIYTTFIDFFIRFYCCLFSTFLESFCHTHAHANISQSVCLCFEREKDLAANIIDNNNKSNMELNT